MEGTGVGRVEDTMTTKMKSTLGHCRSKRRMLPFLSGQECLTSFACLMVSGVNKVGEDITVQ